jgi:hypothetical protein
MIFNRLHYFILDRERAGASPPHTLSTTCNILQVSFEPVLSLNNSLKGVFGERLLHTLFVIPVQLLSMQFFTSSLPIDLRMTAVVQAS